MPAPELTLLYDGSCPLCRWERRKLGAADVEGRLEFIDIQAPGFDPRAYGFTLPQLMERLHGISANGRILIGLDTLLACYRAVGWWWLYLPLSALPSRLGARCYDAFARRRGRIARRIGGRFGNGCGCGGCRRY